MECCPKWYHDLSVNYIEFDFPLYILFNDYSYSYLKLRGCSKEDFRLPKLIPCFLPNPRIDDAIEELDDFFFPLIDEVELHGLFVEPIESNLSLVSWWLSFDKRLDKDALDDFGDASTMVIVWLCFVSLCWIVDESNERLLCIEERDDIDLLIYNYKF